jgi:hypothetical protein
MFSQYSGLIQRARVLPSEHKDTKKPYINHGRFSVRNCDLDDGVGGTLQRPAVRLTFRMFPAQRGFLLGRSREIS